MGTQTKNQKKDTPGKIEEGAAPTVFTLNEGETYSKDHDKVVKNEILAHESYIQQITERLEQTGIRKSALTEAVGSLPPMTYRMLDPNLNVTLNTMARYAQALGGRLEIKVLYDE